MGKCIKHKRVYYYLISELGFSIEIWIRQVLVWPLWQKTERKVQFNGNVSFEYINNIIINYFNPWFKLFYQLFQIETINFYYFVILSKWRRPYIKLLLLISLIVHPHIQRNLSISVALMYFTRKQIGITHLFGHSAATQQQ